MSSPRVDYVRQCEGKVRHGDRRAARRARQKLGHRDAGGHLTIYRCPWCDAFHVGSAWADPFIVDREERARRRELELEDLDVVVAVASARILGITVEAALELLASSTTTELDELELLEEAG